MKTNVIHNVDILEGFKLIDDNSIDLIVTSPPYNIDLEYDSWNDNLHWDEYLKWCKSWLNECYRVLKDDGRIAINHYINFHTKHKTSEFPLMDFRQMQRDIGFNPYKLVIWEDNNMKKMHAFGSFKSASAPHIQTPYEGILISYKKQWKKIERGISTLDNKYFVELVSGVWKLKPETKGLTVANFPIQLPLNCINLLSYKDDVVLDPFMGSGTTAIACLMSERKYIGFEISKNYHKISEDRINDLNEKKNSSEFLADMLNIN